LKSGVLLVDQAIKLMDSADRFFAKNLSEARKYERLFLELQHKINSREIVADDAAAP
jgi:hypothetical protein